METDNLLTAEEDDNVSTSSDDVTKEAESQHIRKPLRVAITAVMALGYICMGLNSGVVSPTMLDLAELQHHNLEELSRGLMLKPFGVLCGSVLGGVMSDRFRHRADIFLCLLSLFGALSIAAYPWCPDMLLFTLALFINGLTHGSYNVVCSSICMAIWREHSSTPVHALHMSYTIGTTIAPPLASAFLSYHPTNQTRPSDQLTEGSAISRMIVQENNHTYSNDTYHESQIYYPYAGIGMLQGLVCVSYFCLCLSGRMRQSVSHMERKSLKDMVKPTTCRHGSTAFWKIFIVCIVIIYVGIMIRDRALSLYVCPMGVDAGLTKQTAVWLGFVFNMTSLAGRVVSVFLAPWVRVHVMVYVECILIILCLLALAMLSTFDMPGTLYLWIMIPLIGFIMSPNYASVMAWINRYIEVTGLVVATIDVGIGLGSLLSTWAVGLLLHRYGSTVCYWFSLGGAVLVMMPLVPSQIMGLIEGDRHDNKHVSDNDHDETATPEHMSEEPSLDDNDDELIGNPLLNINEMDGDYLLTG